MAAGFLAAAGLATAFFAAGLAAAFLTAGLVPATAAFRPAPGKNLGTDLAGIFSTAPVVAGG